MQANRDTLTFQSSMKGSAKSKLDEIQRAYLLTNHKSDGDKSSVPVSLDGPHFTLQIHKRCSANETTLSNC